MVQLCEEEGQGDEGTRRGEERPREEEGQSKRRGTWRRTVRRRTGKERYERKRGRARVSRRMGTRISTTSSAKEGYDLKQGGRGGVRPPWAQQEEGNFMTIAPQNMPCSDEIDKNK